MLMGVVEATVAGEELTGIVSFVPGSAATLLSEALTANKALSTRPIKFSNSWRIAIASFAEIASPPGATRTAAVATLSVGSTGGDWVVGSG